MGLNSIYIFLTIVSVVLGTVYSGLKAMEVKKNIRILPYSGRKRFIEELKNASKVAQDLFEERLLKKGTRYGFVTFIVGIILFVLIILEAVMVPFNLRIVVYFGTLNYYFFAYFTDVMILFLLLYLPLILDLKIINLHNVRFIDLDMYGETYLSKFDEIVHERNKIKLYHYIKNFWIVSASVAFGFFFQSIIIENIPYFYYQTNLVIAFFPLAVFVIFISIILLFGRIRISLIYDTESRFFMWLAFLTGTSKTLLLKTSKNGIFSGTPKICYVEGIGGNLKISYEWNKEKFVSYVEWKDVDAFGLPDLKQTEDFEKGLAERGINTDSKFDN